MIWANEKKLMQIENLERNKKMEVIGKGVQVLNVNTGEIYKGTIQSFNIKLDKPIYIDALAYDSTITHIEAPGNYYRILVDGKKDKEDKENKKD